MVPAPGIQCPNLKDLEHFIKSFGMDVMASNTAHCHMALPNKAAIGI